MARYARWGLPLVAIGVVVGLTLPAVGRSSDVTRGDFSTFAGGEDLGYDVSGRAQMVRTKSSTKVSVQVEGLDPDQEYASHVHDRACDVEDAGGHFKQDPGGEAAPPNEIWPGGGPFRPNPAGVANLKARSDYVANRSAVSVVVHLRMPDGGAPKIACADLS